MYTVDWNIDILVNRLTLVDNSLFFNREVLLVRAVFNTIGFICLIIGGINKIEIPFLTDKLKLDYFSIGVGITVLTLILQLTARLI